MESLQSPTSDVKADAVLFVDTHCHIDDVAFAHDRSFVLQRAIDAGVQRIVVPGIAPLQWESLRTLCTGHRVLAPAFGIHPQCLSNLPASQDDQHLATLDRLLASGPAHAVGECGLDERTARSVSWDRQTAILLQHGALAQKHRKPLIVHCLGAHKRLRDLLESGQLTGPLVIHSYSGPPDWVAAYVRLGCWLSFAGALTYTNARRPLQSLLETPLDRLMFETDSPDQTPVPFRPGRCEPAHVRSTVGVAADALGVPAATLAKKTSVTAMQFFSLPTATQTQDSL